MTTITPGCLVPCTPAPEAGKCTPSAAFGQLTRKKPLASRAAASARTFFDSADYQLNKETGNVKDVNNDVGAPVSSSHINHDIHVVHWQALVQQAEVKTPHHTQVHMLAAPQLMGSPHYPYSCTPGTQPLYKGARRASRLSECSLP